jgi:cyclopropane-fatty-acyl-phospholipid synthase
VSARIVDELQRRVARRLAGRLSDGGGSFALQLTDGTVVPFGSGPPAATLILNTTRGLAALATMDGTRLAEAYRSGDLDVQGDLRRLLSVRDSFGEFHPLTWAWQFVRPLLRGQVASDADWIAAHYDYDADFYQLFLDDRHRCYSQAIFASDDEALEPAVTRKLAFAADAVEARPGARILDIGGGWGAFTEYGGQRDFRVTSLTISAQSERFIQSLIDRDRLPCQVVREHLFAHAPAEQYDAIVNLGVTEHLPDYPRTLAKYLRLLKPGGRIYLDSAASRLRHDLSAFLLRHIFPGNGTLLCLDEYLTAVARTPFEVLGVYNDRRNYGLTTERWAGNLDAHREQIEQRWGKALYRTFQLYLWGCVDGFARDMIQAYRVVLALPSGTGR